MFGHPNGALGILLQYTSSKPLEPNVRVGGNLYDCNTMSARTMLFLSYLQLPLVATVMCLESATAMRAMVELTVKSVSL